MSDFDEDTIIDENEEKPLENWNQLENVVDFINDNLTEDSVEFTPHGNSNIQLLV